MNARTDDEDTWAVRPVLDTVALVLLAIVCAEVIGAVIAALDLSAPRNAVGLTAGPLPNPLGTTPLGERLQQATGWATAFQGVVLLASLGLVTIPRVVWDTTGEAPSAHRVARFVAAVSVALGAMLAAGGVLGAVNLFWLPGEPSIGFQSPETPLLVERVIAAGLGGFVVWISLLARTRALP
jgi:hypothetical protein